MLNNDRTRTGYVYTFGWQTTLRWFPCCELTLARPILAVPTECQHGFSLVAEGWATK